MKSLTGVQNTQSNSKRMKDSIEKWLKREGFDFKTEPKLTGSYVIESENFKIGVATQFHDKYTVYDISGGKEEEVLHSKHPEEVMEKIEDILEASPR